ncbi:MAG: UDP-N-acetylmuramate--L-alanine ligase [Bacteroidaceae bacterium]|nr:UDP-N-acetylmuramate--L-alanine ligase [Bacteroidaceae bacterium]
MEAKPRIIISGGGTGGHIFPAISIAHAIKALKPDAEILFVGAEGRMEMQRVPAAGFEIKGLPICGFDRKNPFKNIAVLFKIMRSQMMARKIIKQFRPMVAVGVGGYASGPTLRIAGKMGIPTLLQEQNSYAGVTNKILAKKAGKICVAYDGMERFFPADKIIKTGNPVRPSLTSSRISRKDAAARMGLDASKRIVLIIGGSLGARTLNESVMSNLELIRMSSDVQFVWQTGKFYFEEMKRRLADEQPVENLFPVEFVQDMDQAYAAADLVISRAGAGSISELCLLGKPVILVPSPNVAEDHQTKNALALSDKDAAIHIRDVDARKELIPAAVDLVKDKARLESLSENILKLAYHDSAEIIAHEVLKLAGMGCGTLSLKDIKSVYFVGAGGIGMSALVRYFLARGCQVGGYDKTSTDLTSALIKEGAKIGFEDGIENVDDCFKDPESTLVVYTPAIPADNRILRWFNIHCFDVQKRAQVLGTLTRSLDGLCVAGTHGKTTTSSMVAHILDGTDEGCNAFLGGILKNIGSNLMISNKSRRVVIEADEFDRSFHHLTPLRTVITAVDADHLDIYGTYEAYVESFRKYTSLIKPGGDVILHVGLAEKIQPQLQEGVNLYTYGLDEGTFHAANIRIGNGELRFDYVSPLGSIADVELGVPIPINVENAVAAMAMAQLSGASDDVIRERIGSFRGCDRRFDFHLKTPRKVYLSDYAHHPAEIKQCALSLRKLYADRKITCIFQPHLYTRTRDFYNEFADSLSIFDQVWLLEIYPAREQPIPGVTSNLLADNMKPGVCKGIISRNQVPELVESIKDDVEVLVTLGAGDLEDYVDTITKILKGK